MKFFRKMRKNNKGAGIVTVLVTVTVVTLMAAMMLTASYLIYMMKVTEASGNKNKNSAASVVEEIRSGLYVVVSDSIEDAYAKVLPDYALKGVSIAKTFNSKYRENVLTWKSDSGKALFNKVNGAYQLNTDAIMEMIVDYRNSGAQISVTCSGVSIMENVTTDDPSSNFFVKLQDFSVNYTSGKFTESIVCDLTIQCPDITYSLTQYAVSGLPQYCVIAGAELAQSDGKQAEIAGGVYANAMDLVSNGFLSITRGSFICKNGIKSSGISTMADGAGGMMSRFLIGEGVDLYTSDVAVSGGSVSLLGNSYVANDLTFSGVSPKVTLGGKYFGFGNDPVYSYHSSSIISNTRNASLNMDSLEELSLAGVSFIGTEREIINGNSPMGESISAMSNSGLYLAPASSVTFDGNKMRTNPEVYTEQPDLTKFKLVTGGISGYGRITLKPVSIPVASNYIVYFFLEFDSAENRAKYFTDYYSENKSGVDNSMKNYLNISAVNPITVTATGAVYLGDRVAVVTGRDLTDKCNINNRQFTSLCTNLSTVLDYVDADDGTVDGKVDYYAIRKAGTKCDLIPNIIKKDRVAAIGASKSIPFYDEENGNNVALVVNGDYEYTASSDSDIRIIICNGDVRVSADYNGIIIATGNVTVNANITAATDEVVAAYKSIGTVNGKQNSLSYFFADGVVLGDNSTNNDAWAVDEQIDIVYH